MEPPRRATPKKKGHPRKRRKVPLATLRRHCAVASRNPAQPGWGLVFTRDLAGCGAVDGEQRRDGHLRFLPLRKIQSCTATGALMRASSYETLPGCSFT
jgi:hypothetical protein